MTPTDVLELPHTVDEALDVLRAFDRAKAEDIANRTIRVRVKGPGIDADTEAQALQTAGHQVLPIRRSGRPSLAQAPGPQGPGLPARTARQH